MTALSSLIGGTDGGGHPYPSGVPIIGLIPDSISGANIADTDYLLPFVPRADLTVGKLWWYRANATAADIYIGVIDASGNRLDDCAVDNNTTIGLHEINTTNFDMTAGNWYGVVINASAAVIGGELNPSRGDVVTAQHAIYAMLNPVQLSMFSGGTFPTTPDRWPIITKGRTNSAIPDPVTMTGYSGGVDHLLLGVVPA